jgi:inhibitor of KinA sporulation pathway (predicted exonuclease)
MSDAVTATAAAEDDTTTTCPTTRFLIVLDFEATCREDADPNKKKKARRCEIIEFPMIVYDSVTMNSVASFREYVRPVVDSVLTPFCTRLTGITQATVDGADAFPAVFKRVQTFLAQHGLTPENSTFVTVGNWDLQHMLPSQIELSAAVKKTRLPLIFRKWINIKKMFTSSSSLSASANSADNLTADKDKDKYKNKNKEDTSLQGMLKTAGMEFEGRPHSGWDDTVNTCRLVEFMLKKGAWHEEGCVGSFHYSTLECRSTGIAL